MDGKIARDDSLVHFIIFVRRNGSKKDREQTSARVLSKEILDSEFVYFFLFFFFTNEIRECLSRQFLGE